MMRLPSIVITIAIMLNQCPLAVAFDGQREQEFVVTAYYSPLPDQCCYIKGSLEDDKILNGNGTHAADGTPVYAGMIAAPSSYAFGTRVELPGLGVFTVHDRGGAITEWDDAHRIDIWVGEGEEGLARALAFGVWRGRGTVFASSQLNAPANHFAVGELPAPLEILRPYLVAGSTLSGHYPVMEQKGLTVRLLQEKLKQAGYFNQEITGYFGPVTQNSLKMLIADMHLEEPDDRLTAVSAAYLEAAIAVRSRVAPDSVPVIDAFSDRSSVAKAQRLLRYLGHYRGRTDGVYSESLRIAITNYQKAQRLIAGNASPGAGRIGPLTKLHLTNAWNKKRIAAIALTLLDRVRIQTILAERGELFDDMLLPGSSGDAVRRMQTLLADRGYFPPEKINGNFGALTKDSILRYQLDRGIIETASDTGAGTVGPNTAATLVSEQVTDAYRMVRGGGWQTL